MAFLSGEDVFVSLLTGFWPEPSWTMCHVIAHHRTLIGVKCCQEEAMSCCYLIKQAVKNISYVIFECVRETFLNVPSLSKSFRWALYQSDT